MNIESDAYVYDTMITVEEMEEAVQSEEALNNLISDIVAEAISHIKGYSKEEVKEWLKKD